MLSVLTLGSGVTKAGGGVTSADKESEHPELSHARSKSVPIGIQNLHNLHAIMKIFPESFLFILIDNQISPLIK